jgi:branched-chain amino acid transport system substrate-binding protein
MSQSMNRRTFVAGSAAAAALSTTRAWAQSGEIVLGATVPLTGPLAASGQQYHHALQLAQDDINAKGGIGGKKIKIVFEDTQASNSIAVNAFVKLSKELNPPFIFLSSYSTQNLATEPEVAKAKIPTMYAGGADVIHLRKNPYMFRLRPYDTVTTTAIARTVINRLKSKKAGVIYVQDDFGQGSATLVEGMLQKGGVEVVTKEAFGARDNDMSAQLLNIKNKGADVIVGFTYVRDGALVIKGRKALGIDVPMVTSGATVLPPTLALLDPEDLTKLYATTDAFLDASQGPKVADYVKRFTDRFKLKPDPFGSCYYDGALMLAEIMGRVGPDREKIKTELAKTKAWPGVTQSYTADEFGNLSHATTIVQFKPGTKDFALVEKVALN